VTVPVSLSLVPLCDLRVIIYMQLHAISGGNAAINIKSFSTQNEYEFHTGGFLSGATLKDPVVKLAK
jgi:hypothetical protein